MVDNPNPYDPPGGSSHDRGGRFRAKNLLYFAAVGFVVEVLFYGFAVFSLGFGHGSARTAHFLFPIAEAFFDGGFADRPDLLATVIDYVQYIVYFAIVGLASMFRRVMTGLLLVVLTHGTAIVIAYQ